MLTVAAIDTEKTTTKTTVKDNDDVKTMVKMMGIDDDGWKGWLVPSAGCISQL